MRNSRNKALHSYQQCTEATIAKQREREEGGKSRRGSCGEHGVKILRCNKLGALPYHTRLTILAINKTNQESKEKQYSAYHDRDSNPDLWLTSSHSRDIEDYYMITLEFIGFGVLNVRDGFTDQTAQL